MMEFLWHPFVQPMSHTSSELMCCSRFCPAEPRSRTRCTDCYQDVVCAGRVGNGVVCCSQTITSSFWSQELVVPKSRLASVSRRSEVWHWWMTHPAMPRTEKAPAAARERAAASTISTEVAVAARAERRQLPKRLMTEQHPRLALTFLPSRGASVRRAMARTRRNHCHFQCFRHRIGSRPIARKQHTCFHQPETAHPRCQRQIAWHLVLHHSQHSVGLRHHLLTRRTRTGALRCRRHCCSSSPMVAPPRHPQMELAQSGRPWPQARSLRQRQCELCHFRRRQLQRHVVPRPRTPHACDGVPRPLALDRRRFHQRIHRCSGPCVPLVPLATLGRGNCRGVRCALSMRQVHVGETWSCGVRWQRCGAKPCTMRCERSSDTSHPAFWSYLRLGLHESWKAIRKRSEECWRRSRKDNEMSSRNCRMRARKLVGRRW